MKPCTLSRLISLAFIFFATSIFAFEQLIIEPDAGSRPLLAAIKKADSSIDLIMYGLTDLTFTDALIQAKKSGKKVNVLLETNPYRAANENNFTIKHLQSANIPLQQPNSHFKLTHQKTLLIDHHDALVMTLNLTRSAFKNQRNFVLMLDDPAMVEEIAAVYHADSQNKNITTHHPNLIWSPNNSREKIINFIKSTRSEIKIYAHTISDYQIIGELAHAARTGKSVYVLISKETNAFTGKMNFLRKAGVHIHAHPHYIIHAKVIIIDKDRAILGSTNLTAPSLDHNRELAVMTQDPTVIKQLVKTFEQDWQTDKKD